MSKSLTGAGEPGEVQPGYLGSTPPPEAPPAKGERTWVDRAEQLARTSNILQQASVIAIDAEFTQARSHVQKTAQVSSNRLALLQFAIDGRCFVVDAWRLNDLSPLNTITADTSKVILLHGAGADLQVMAARGLNVAHYIDLEAASRSIFGPQESSLAAMLRRAFNLYLDKSLQRTDWTHRPLSTAMIAYAARDAEMTLALYHWLKRHYAWALQLHEHTDRQERVAGWIEPFLRGPSSIPLELAIKEAREQGLLSDEQIYADCRAALATFTYPMQRSRLLRLVADLSLKELSAEIEPLLQAQAADERAAAARALGRMGVVESKRLIQPLLQDAVYDVRKAAQIALRNLSGQPSGQQRAVPTRLADGSRAWTIGDTQGADEDDGNDWKARLRGMMGR